MTASTVLKLDLFQVASCDSIFNQNGQNTEN